MIDVTGVRFKSSGKVYYFDPGDFELSVGQGVIVETARGMEFGIVTMKTTPIKEEDITRPLKKIVRIADERDHHRHEENERKKAKAMNICQEKIQKHKLDMKLIDVEYTFDNNKIIFYFTADGRVDFRELVKDLAGVFKMRIELRQIGVRDEAKMLGGVGSCGRGLCCATWLPDFQPVSIKMAKVQNLSLNPAKISGVCGRLMCCLKYENDVYLEMRKDLPDVNEKVMTEDGLGKVIESDVLLGKIKVRLYTGEKDDNGNDKLSSDVMTLKKDAVERLGKKKPQVSSQPKSGKRAEASEKTKERTEKGKRQDRSESGEKTERGERTERVARTSNSRKNAPKEKPSESENLIAKEGEEKKNDGFRRGGRGRNRKPGRNRRRRPGGKDEQKN